MAERSRVASRLLLFRSVEQHLRLGGGVLVVANLAVDEGERGKVKLVGREGRRVAGLREDLDRQLKRLVERDDLLLVLLLHERRGCLVVGTDARGLPAVVVARWVRLVELEAVGLVPPCVVR
jgi:hypothetical protein